MIIIIDNYDSFTYNLYQYVGHHYNDVCVYKNDDLKLEDLNAKNIKAIIFSGQGYLLMLVKCQKSLNP